jgi:DNA (cytosine-5)-methyltransferase 1
MNKKPTFIELFAGIGGFRLGFEKAGYECVFSSEFNNSCKDVYLKNFKEMPLGDITEISTAQIPDFDVLTAGFPCQPFSICGKRKGFEDTRGTLFFDVCRIIKDKKPKVVFLENVKHILHHDNGKTIKVIVATLEELGYFVNFKILNAKDFGVPQNRERIIIMATKGKSFNFNYLKLVKTSKLKDFLDDESIFNEGDYLDESEYTLIENPVIQDSGLIFVGYRNKNIWKKGIRPNTEHLSRVHRQPNRIYSVEGVHPTLPSQETSGRFFIYLPEINKVRKLTIDECYKIMGFPKDFIKSNIISDIYKQIGNSVCVPLIKSLAEELVNQEFLKDGLFKEPERYIQQVLIYN